MERIECRIVQDEYYNLVIATVQFNAQNVPVSYTARDISGYSYGSYDEIRAVRDELDFALNNPILYAGGDRLYYAEQTGLNR